MSSNLLYRVNYGNGQVSHSFTTKKAAMRHRAELDLYQEFAFIEFRDPDTGDWFSCGGGQ